MAKNVHEHMDLSTKLRILGEEKVRLGNLIFRKQEALEAIDTAIGIINAKLAETLKRQHRSKP